MAKASNKKPNNRKQRREAKFGQPKHLVETNRPIAEGTSPLDRRLAVAFAVVGIITAYEPRTPIFIIIAMTLSFALLWHPGWNCWGLRNSRALRVMFLASHGILLAAFGWYIWPRVTISPKLVTFTTGQSFRFRVRNETPDDAYMVSALLYLSDSASLRDFNVVLDPRSTNNIAQVLAGVSGFKCTDGKGGKVLAPTVNQISAGGENWFTVVYHGLTKATVRASISDFDVKPSASDESLGGSYITPVQRTPPGMERGTCEILFSQQTGGKDEK